MTRNPTEKLGIPQLRTKTRQPSFSDVEDLFPQKKDSVPDVMSNDKYVLSKTRAISSNFRGQLKTGRIDVRQSPNLSSGILGEARRVRVPRLGRM